MLIDNLKQQFPHHDLRKFDIITDVFPDADIWHCRHCLFHLSLSDIQKSLENFLRSNIQTALITNHFMPDLITFDIPTGSYRPSGFDEFSFYLPKPERWLLDCELLGAAKISWLLEYGLESRFPEQLKTTIIIFHNIKRLKSYGVRISENASAHVIELDNQKLLAPKHWFWPQFQQNWEPKPLIFLRDI